MFVMIYGAYVLAVTGVMFGWLVASACQANRERASRESYPPSLFHFPLRHPVPAGRPPQDYITHSHQHAVVYLFMLVL
jgi:hypothetical protein